MSFTFRFKKERTFLPPAPYSIHPFSSASNYLPSFYSPAVLSPKPFSFKFSLYDSNSECSGYDGWRFPTEISVLSSRTACWKTNSWWKKLKLPCPRILKRQRNKFSQKNRAFLTFWVNRVVLPSLLSLLLPLLSLLTTLSHHRFIAIKFSAAEWSANL